MLGRSKTSRNQKGGIEQTGTNAGDAQQAEKLQRARGVVQQKFYDQQIEKDAKGAADAVVGSAAFAIEIGDGDFGDFRAGGTGQRRNEAVEFAVELNFLNDFAAVGFKGGAEVVQVDAASAWPSSSWRRGWETGASANDRGGRDASR